jgi:hypothetical protein
MQPPFRDDPLPPTTASPRAGAMLLEISSPNLQAVYLGWRNTRVLMGKNTSSELSVRLSAVERLTQLFRLERLVYLGVTVLALAMLLVSAGILIWNQKAGAAELSTLFGASGLITYSCGRLLFMWNKALSIIFSLTTEEKP